MVQERLICPSNIELSATKELIHVHFPLVSYNDVHDPFEYVSDFSIATEMPVFFRWAVTSQSESGLCVVTYCFNLSLQLFDPPTWMKLALVGLNIPLKS